MTENNTKHNLNFDLPSQQAANGHSQSKSVIGLLLLIFIAVSANTIISLKIPDFSKTNPNTSGLDVEQQKKLAIKLEKQGLYSSAAIAWKEYLSKGVLDKTEEGDRCFLTGGVENW